MFFKLAAQSMAWCLAVLLYFVCTVSSASASNSCSSLDMRSASKALETLQITQYQINNFSAQLSQQKGVDLLLSSYDNSIPQTIDELSTTLAALEKSELPQALEIIEKHLYCDGKSKAEIKKELAQLRDRNAQRIAFIKQHLQALNAPEFQKQLKEFHRMAQEMIPEKIYSIHQENERLFRMFENKAKLANGVTYHRLYERLGAEIFVEMLGLKINPKRLDREYREALSKLADEYIIADQVSYRAPGALYDILKSNNLLGRSEMAIWILLSAPYDVSEVHEQLHMRTSQLALQSVHENVESAFSETSAEEETNTFNKALKYMRRYFFNMSQFSLEVREAYQIEEVATAQPVEVKDWDSALKNWAIQEYDLMSDRFWAIRSVVDGTSTEWEPLFQKLSQDSEAKQK